MCEGGRVGVRDGVRVGVYSFEKGGDLCAPWSVKL